jgi:hypothetical protein
MLIACPSGPTIHFGYVPSRIHPYNVCFIRNCTKYRSNTLPCFVRFFMKQTLVAVKFWPCPKIINCTFVKVFKYPWKNPNILNYPILCTKKPKYEVCLWSKNFFGFGYVFKTYSTFLGHFTTWVFFWKKLQHQNQPTTCNFFGILKKNLNKKIKCNFSKYWSKWTGLKFHGYSLINMRQLQIFSADQNKTILWSQHARTGKNR